MKWKLVLVCFLLICVVQVLNAETLVDDTEETNPITYTTETNLTYSGYLTKSGAPLSGSYGIIFRLYDVETGGKPLDSYSNAVVVDEGYFTTELKFNKEFFDGRPLWLGIQIKGDSEMTPRLKLNEVPYSTSPKFLITEQQVDFTGLEVKEGLNVYTTEDNTYGIFSNTTGYHSQGLYAYTIGDESDGVYARTEGDGSMGLWTRTEGANSDGVRASTYGDNSEGLYALTYGTYSDGVHARTYGGDSDGICVNTSGDHSEGVHARTEGDESRGVYAITEGIDSGGIHTETYGDYSDGAFVLTEGYDSGGVIIYTEGDQSNGITSETGGNRSVGIQLATFGRDSPGVDVATLGYGSEGVYAYSSESHGVVGKTGSSHSNPINPEFGGLFLGDSYSLGAGTSEDDIKFSVDDNGNVRADGSLYLNYQGATQGIDEDQYIYFAEDGHPQGDWLMHHHEGKFELSNGLTVHGHFLVREGTKFFVMDHPQNASEEIYYATLEGGEAGVYTRGTASLEDGVAVVDLPEHFELVASDEGLTVQVTPLGNCNGLYVEEKSTSEIVVKELMKGDSDVEFDYNVQGIRTGFEDYEVIRSKTDED